MLILNVISHSEFFFFLDSKQSVEDVEDGTKTPPDQGVTKMKGPSPRVAARRRKNSNKPRCEKCDNMLQEDQSMKCDMCNNEHCTTCWKGPKNTLGVFCHSNCLARFKARQ